MSLRELARTKLGIETLRPGQLEVAEAVIAGRDALAIMATGYGKSAIYQLAGLEIPGPTLVVSPLIALQRDQVESLDGLGAAAISSHVPEWERDSALEEAARRSSSSSWHRSSWPTPTCSKPSRQRSPR